MKKLLIFLISISLHPLHSIAQTDSITEEETDLVFEAFTEQKAEFIGGDAKLFEFIRRNMIVPDSFKDGRVIVQFVVEKDSSVSDVRTIGRVDHLLPQQVEASIAVIKRTSGMWIPAKHRDKPARMRLTVPIMFRHD